MEDVDKSLTTTTCYVTDPSLIIKIIDCRQRSNCRGLECQNYFWLTWKKKVGLHVGRILKQRVDNYSGRGHPQPL